MIMEFIQKHDFKTQIIFTILNKIQEDLLERIPKTNKFYINQYSGKSWNEHKNKSYLLINNFMSNKTDDIYVNTRNKLEFVVFVSFIINDKLLNDYSLPVKQLLTVKNINKDDYSNLEIKLLPYIKYL